MNIARILVPMLISAAALTACSNTGTGTDSKPDAGPAVSAIQLKSVSFSGLTLWISLLPPVAEIFGYVADKVVAGGIRSHSI